MQNHETEKKSYTEPTLTTHGDVQSLTRIIHDPGGSGPIRIPG